MRTLSWVNITRETPKHTHTHTQHIKRQFYHKEYFKRTISNKPLVYIYFTYEPKQTYTQKNTIKDDYIDIKVQETEISNIWGNAGEQQQIHFAIECKVIESGYSEYVSDIQKMSTRNFNTPRLPFEGQIAYITNSQYTNLKVKNGINKNLKSHTTINTVQELTDITLFSNFDASYTSTHERNYNNKEFKIYHLLFDYSNIVK